MRQCLVLVLVGAIALTGTCEGFFGKKKNKNPALVELQEIRDTPGGAYCTVPAGWSYTSQNEHPDLPDSIVFSLKKRSQSACPPSFNISRQRADIDQESFVQAMREADEAFSLPVAGNLHFQRMGKIATQMGEADVVMIDLDTNRGPLKIMQGIIVYGEHGYEISAAALADEFTTSYEEFISMIRSFTVNALLETDLTPELEIMQVVETEPDSDPVASADA